MFPSLVRPLHLAPRVETAGALLGRLLLLHRGCHPGLAGERLPLLGCWPQGQVHQRQLDIAVFKPGHQIVGRVPPTGKEMAPLVHQPGHRVLLLASQRGGQVAEGAIEFGTPGQLTRLSVVVDDVAASSQFVDESLELGGVGGALGKALEPLLVEQGGKAQATGVQRGEGVLQPGLDSLPHAGQQGQPLLGPEVGQLGGLPGLVGVVVLVVPVPEVNTGKRNW